LGLQLLLRLAQVLLLPETKERAEALAATMKAEDGLSGAVDSFYRHAALHASACLGRQAASYLLGRAG
jgi:hypothetical protein